jgi:hypothetical protein
MREFVKQVFIYRKDAEGNDVLDASGKPVVDQDLGTFTFRRPTVKDEAEIRIARKRFRTGLTDDDLDDFDRLYIEFNVYFPRLAKEAPANWDWNYVDPRAVIAVMNTYLEGLSEAYGQ